MEFYGENEDLNAEISYRFIDSIENEEEKHLAKLKQSLSFKKLAECLAVQDLQYIESSGDWDLLHEAKKKQKSSQKEVKRVHDEIIRFARFEASLAPFSSNEKTLKKMQKEKGVLKGAWNLSRSTMEDCQGMNTDQLVSVLKMVSLGATHVNFQFTVQGTGTIRAEYDDWIVEFSAKRDCVLKEGYEPWNTDSLNFDLRQKFGSPYIDCYDHDLFHINVNGEVKDCSSLVYLERVEEDRKIYDDLTYTVCVNVCPDVIYSE
ncbi:unnamed protein product [Oikopleura dioica]|uniref:Uncharacterized protein n=1 Tax=Oikopleura dioica TaxID=34765 RepID=E4XSK6_OIKDI|nr:unnamed protein product [Oikopleura dioica]